MRFVTKQTQEAQALFDRFSETECTEEKFREFLRKIFTDPAKPATSSTNASVKKAYETRLQTIQQ